MTGFQYNIMNSHEYKARNEMPINQEKNVSFLRKI